MSKTLPYDRIVQLLAEAVHAEQLVVFTGAGLSIADPSKLPTAAAVASYCYNEHFGRTGERLEDVCRTDLDALASVFFERTDLSGYFLTKLVPWEQFTQRQHNAGHRAVADFLLSNAIRVGATTNYDTLVEQAASDYGTLIRGSISSDEARQTSGDRAPYFKMHGCAVRNPTSSLWTKKQIEPGAPLYEQAQYSRDWVRHELRGRDVVFIGFWSDWRYLNDSFVSALGGAEAGRIFIVDPATEDDLRKKAPELWDLAHANAADVFHVRDSGAKVLADLRVKLSRAYIATALLNAKDEFKGAVGRDVLDTDVQLAENDPEVLYDIRRNIEGQPRPKPPRAARPPDLDIYGLCWLLLKEKGAEVSGSSLLLSGQAIRVFNGQGKSVQKVSDMLESEPPSKVKEDVVIAVTAYDNGLPASIMRSGAPGTVVRPAAPEVISFDDARVRFDI